MGNAWQGHWRARIAEFVALQGHKTLWEYLKANPGVPASDVARLMRDVCAVQVYECAVKECLAVGDMGALVRDLMARSANQDLPRGWGSGDDCGNPGYGNSNALSLYMVPIPQPYRDMENAMADYLLEVSSPPPGWLPRSGDDERLLAAHDHAYRSLPEPMWLMIDRGEYIPDPGSVYRAAIAPIGKLVSIHEGPEVFLKQFQSIRLELGHLFAASWCQSEVCNGGFHQFYANPTGVLAPEAAAGFDAIGMSKCAVIVRRTMSFFGRDYPRERKSRLRKLSPLFGIGRRPHFDSADSEFYGFLKTESEGFASAADRFAARLEEPRTRN